jgi:alkylation response protein AidB-like acyl-CoA dehydrogenase
MSGIDERSSSTTALASPDAADLTFLGESICDVLAGEAGRLQLHEHIDGKTDLGQTLWTRATELGWLGLGLPEALGGLGMGVRGLDVLHRAIGSRAAPGAFMASLSAAQALAEVAGSSAAAEWLPRLATGESSIAVTAQVAGSGTGDLRLLGSPTAEAALVPLDRDSWGLVPFTAPEPIEGWDLTRTLFRASLAAEPAVRLPAMATANAVHRHLALAIASDSIGGARAILEQTVGYMKERQQFGRAIASFQALQHRAADMLTLIVSGEQVVALAVGAAAAGHQDADIWAGLAKARATETFSHVSRDCLQMHGGVGFTWEYDVHVYLKRARLNEVLLAPNPALYDRAADGFAEALRAGREPLELVA